MKAHPLCPARSGQPHEPHPKFGMPAQIAEVKGPDFTKIPAPLTYGHSHVCVNCLGWYLVPNDVFRSTQGH